MYCWRWTLVMLCLAGVARGAERQRLLMDANWRFTLNDPDGVGSVFNFPELRDLAKAHPNDMQQQATLDKAAVDPVATNLGADVTYVQSSFNDSSWRQLDLPHDWAVELPFDQHGSENHGFKAMGGKLGNTIGWYRRKFDLAADDKGKAIWVEFDGVFRDSLVWLNGHCLGRNPSGYTSFWYDLSKYANYGGSNELVVRVDATRTEGWFYEGAGIYRHVWLMITDPLHVAHWGTYVVSDVLGQNAVVTARATIRNDSPAARGFEVDQTVQDTDGKTVAAGSDRATGVEPATEKSVRVILPVIYNANLWSLEKPYLYKLVTTVRDDTGVLDRYETPFGIRTLRFDPDQGFFLNGQHVEIQGVCDHQDHAGVGSALPDRLNYYRIELLKQMGCNALRTSHNDPTPEVLDACDKLGMLVMDEHRQMGISPVITQQLTSLVLRDRNHPSVFIWSIGNEEGGIQAGPVGITVAESMQDAVHHLDPTRPCTEAMNGGWRYGLSTIIDVMGFNYLRQGGGRQTNIHSIDDYHSMDQYHAAFPLRPSLATEEASTLSTRGIYANDRDHGYMSAYDVNRPSWGSLAEEWWPYYLKRPWVAGGFVWTGFDYRGEPTPYHWPCISSQFGILDTCGFPKDNFYYYQAWWTKQPVLHLFPHWNWAGKEGQPIDVWCHTNYDAVELFLNGQSQGKKTVVPDYHVEWKVPYAPGTLEARAYKGDQVAATQTISTTGAPAKLALVPDRATINADGQDLSIVRLEVQDAQGRVVPTAGNLVKFTLTGDAKIIGVGNGDPSCHEPDKASQRSAFCGLCMAIVQSGPQGGTLQLTASSDGLNSATTAITTQHAPAPAAVP